MGSRILGGPEEALRRGRASVLVAGRSSGGRYGSGRLVRRVFLRRRTFRFSQRRFVAALSDHRYRGARGFGSCVGSLLVRSGISRSSYGVADSLAYRLADLLLVRETHQLLGGVDVDVHSVWVNPNQQCHRRVATRRHGRSVGVIYALGQALGPDPPAVYRDRLARAAALGDARQRRVARDLEGALLVLHPAHRPRLAHAVELGEALY